MQPKATTPTTISVIDALSANLWCPIRLFFVYFVQLGFGFKTQCHQEQNIGVFLRKTTFPALDCFLCSMIRMQNALFVEKSTKCWRPGKHRNFETPDHTFDQAWVNAVTLTTPLLMDIKKQSWKIPAYRNWKGCDPCKPLWNRDGFPCF